MISPAEPAQSQVPAAGKVNLDHVAHFVPHIDSASAALERLGFTLTPFSAQSHRLEPGGPVLPAGTANRCVMLCVEDPQQGAQRYVRFTSLLQIDTAHAALNRRLHS